ncbi:MAG TPA: transcriptional regulator NrdR [Acidimicrobiia bacterium]|nr:transcriptional regulator NrdR [Acidimicrobiia bacterium]
MLCPVCGSPDTRVIDSRPAESGQAIRRRRECEGCAQRFTTYERVEPQLMVRKRDGRLEQFSTAKLVAGISAALADRPVSDSSIRRLGEEVETSLRVGGGQVSSEDIGAQVLARLRALDEVAYLRFASVYKDFQDAADFEKEVAALESAE